MISLCADFGLIMGLPGKANRMFLGIVKQKLGQQAEANSSGRGDAARLKKLYFLLR